jgi:hypothetical protein
MAHVSECKTGAISDGPSTRNPAAPKACAWAITDRMPAGHHRALPLQRRSARPCPTSAGDTSTCTLRLHRLGFHRHGIDRWKPHGAVAASSIAPMSMRVDINATQYLVAPRSCEVIRPDQRLCEAAGYSLRHALSDRDGLSLCPLLP